MSIIQKSQKALEYDKVLLKLAGYAKTAQSIKLCRELAPFELKEDIQNSLNLTKEAKSLLDNAIDIPIDFIQNFEELKKKNEYFKEEELIDIAKTLRVFRLVNNFLKENLTYDSDLCKLSGQIYTNKNRSKKDFL